MATNTPSMAPPSEVPVPLPRQRGQRISPQVWNEQRPRFQKLYVDLDMSLPETMKAMEDTHNFYASEKQYKTKIKEWSFTKYVNEDKMENILRKKKRRREEEGKDTIFTLNGREVEHEKLNRFQKRRKLQDDEIGSSTVSTASHVKYYTPPGQSPYVTLAGQSPERTGSETGSSLAPSTIASGTRSSSTSGSSLLRLSWKGLDMRTLRDMDRRANTLLMDDKPTEALEILRQVHAGYEYLLGPDQDDVIATVNTMGHACFESGNDNEAEALLRRAVFCHESTHGPEDPRSLMSVASLARLYGKQGRLEDSEVLYVRAIQGLDQMLPSSDKVLEVISELAYVCYFQAFYEKARVLYEHVIAGYRSLGAGYEDALLDAEAGLCYASRDTQDPATDSLLVDVLAKYEARYGENHESVLAMLTTICKRYWHRQDDEKLELYYQRLAPFIIRSFGKDQTISHGVYYEGMSLASFQSEIGRYDEAESLFIRLKLKTYELISSHLTGRGGRLRTYRLFRVIIFHAEHYIRQSKWKDAEPHLLKAKSLESPTCRSVDSRALVRALKKFRNGSGREAGALPLTQRTSDNEAQSSPRMPGQTAGDVDTAISAGSAEFQQSLGEIDWSNFPLPSPGALSLSWSPQQPQAPPGVSQPGLVMNWENSDMMGIYDLVE